MRNRSTSITIVIAALVVLSAFLQTMIVGITTHWRLTGEHFLYTQLADGFLHGRLSLPKPPAPQLLALPNPYDPAANARFREHDLVLFKQKYYLYWGPVPAMLLAAISLPLRIQHPMFGDQWPTLIFMIGTVALAAVLMLQIRRRLFPEGRLAIAAIMICSLGLGAPLLYAVTTPEVYEAAIAGGQFFLLAGFCAAWIALGGDRPRSFPLLIAGICWALSAGSRISLVPAIGLVTLLTIIRLRRFPSRIPVVALVAPLVIGAALFAEYNFLRFHNALEFGLRFQLTGTDQHAGSKEPLWSFRFITPDALTYLLTAPRVLDNFPYLGAGRPNWLSSFFSLPIIFAYRAMIGLVFTQPLFIAAGFVFSRKKDPLLRWLTWSLFLAAVIGFGPPLTIPGYAMRYLLDLTPCVTVLAAIGFWRLLERIKDRLRLTRWICFTAGLLLAVQCFLAFCMVIERPWIHSALAWTR